MDMAEGPYSSSSGSEFCSPDGSNVENCSQYLEQVRTLHVQHSTGLPAWAARFGVGRHTPLGARQRACVSIEAQNEEWAGVLRTYNSGRTIIVHPQQVTEVAPVTFVPVCLL